MNLWLLGHDDLWWSVLVDPDRGVFSQDFIRAFFPALGQYRAQYMGLATSVYRECSEYVHGNPRTHEEVDSIVGYDRAKALSYYDKVATVRLCILFQFVSRYLQSLGSEKKNKIEHLLLEEFGALPEIQASFEVLGK